MVRNPGLCFVRLQGVARSQWHRLLGMAAPLPPPCPPRVMAASPRTKGQPGATWRILFCRGEGYFAETLSFFLLV